MAGATGLIGTALKIRFKKEGHIVRLLTTNKKIVNPANGIFYWNVQKGVIDEKALDGIDVLVNLAGASIAGGYWTKKRKNLILNSRVMGSRLLFDSCVKRGIRFNHYIGASAIGFYGPNNSNQPSTESDLKGNGFLADVCAAWEKEHHLFESVSNFVFIMRISNVLSPKGGFLLPFLKLSGFKLRIYLGKYNHRMSWIHIEDLVEFIVYVLRGQIKGVFNLSTSSEEWFELQRKIYDSSGTQFVRLPIPGFLLKFLLGEMSILLTDGCYVSGKKMEETGYKPKYRDIDAALSAIYKELS